LTTLFARLCLAEAFLHGLGGGLYDRLTDDIIRRFFGVEPPGFVILTATCLLPLPVSGRRTSSGENYSGNSATWSSSRSDSWAGRWPN